MKIERIRLLKLANELDAAALKCEDAASGAVDVVELVRALRGVDREVTLALAILEPEAMEGRREDDFV